MFSWIFRSLKGTGFFDSSGFKSLIIRWVEQTLITASIDRGDHSRSRLFRR